MLNRMILSGACVVVLATSALAAHHRGKDLDVVRDPVKLIVILDSEVSIVNDLTQFECERAVEILKKKYPEADAWCWR